MIQIPDLDTIDFEALVEEGRGLIPRYAPAWTDHNLHDPGMTLLDLLAWLIDQQVYRIGFVGDAHVAAFAALLGVEPRDAAPAWGMIWPGAGMLAFDQDLARDKRATPREQPDLFFAVEKNIRLRAAAIDHVDAHIGAVRRRLRPDETDAIVLDDATEVIDLVPTAGLVGDKWPLAIGLAYAEPLPPLGRPPLTASYRGAHGGWQPAPAEWLLAPDGASGVLLMELPEGASAIAAIRLDLSSGLPRRLLPMRVALNVVPVRQIESLEAREIGKGTGWPDQELPLEIAEGTVPIAGIPISAGPGNGLAWQRVDAFSASGPADAHFRFDPERRMVVFGNGINGRAMPLDHEVSRGTLQVTRGAEGNLAAGASWNVTTIDARGSVFGTNRLPISGGTDAWSRDALLTELRRRARKRDVMLTDAEMIGAAMGLAGYGIERAEVLPRFSPAFPNREVPAARTLLLRPSRKVEASDAWLDAIEGALAARRVLGERLAVTAIVPVRIEVEASLLVAAGSDQPRIREEAGERLRQRLGIGRLREDQDIEPWPAGRPVTIAELETLLAAVDGVIAVTGLRLARAGAPLARVSLPLGRLEAAIVAEPVILLEVER
ncbi:MAG: baseplate J/gp47 family protein [Sphingomonas sp.]|uniref:hypothetical protein n=1 Tax=Sphingomonas sp. TaxID=28214 RepID=UPI0025F50770|nr:hypothetical protein [Sphingomonas sp.]MBQ1500529.1 baseplate J/gp47 family protein [Sphingomonas sp.]